VGARPCVLAGTKVAGALNEVDSDCVPSLARVAVTAPMATTAATPPMIDNLFTPLMSIFPLDDPSICPTAMALYGDISLLRLIQAKNSYRGYFRRECCRGVLA
jgi:hypothetical protein